jgi:hypothetical protein
VKRRRRRMNRIFAPKFAAWERNVDRWRSDGSDWLQQNKGCIDRPRRPLLMFLFSSGAALVGVRLRPWDGTAGVGSHFVGALTLDAAVHPRFRRGLPACARRDARAQEGQNGQGCNRAGDHCLRVSHWRGGTATASGLTLKARGLWRGSSDLTQTFRLASCL